MIFALSLLLKPFIMLVIFGLIVIPVEIAFIRYFPEGKIKTLLLKRIG
jgi:hypothetical protein